MKYHVGTHDCGGIFCSYEKKAFTSLVKAIAHMKKLAAKDKEKKKIVSICLFDGERLSKVLAIHDNIVEKYKVKDDARLFLNSRMFVNRCSMHRPYIDAIIQCVSDKPCLIKNVELLSGCVKEFHGKQNRD